MERVDNKDFLAMENTLKESGSHDCILTVYDVRRGRVARRFLLKTTMQPGTILDVMTDYGDEPRISKKVLLPSDSVDRLLKAIELTLTKKVYAPSGLPLKPDSVDYSTIWVHLKIDSRTAASGMVLLSRCQTGEASTPPFLEVLYSLLQCADIEGSDRPPLVELDLAISNLRLSYPE